MSNNWGKKAKIEGTNEQTFGAFTTRIVVAHHERWDGNGYPYGLTQDAIPLGARILAVVDAYDAMTSQRPYRQALSAADVVNKVTSEQILRRRVSKQRDE